MLFDNCSKSEGHVVDSQPEPPSAGQMPPILQRLMSTPGRTVQEIEQQQRGEIPRDQMPQPVGAEAPTGSVPCIAGQQPVPVKTSFFLPEPQSPDTALKRTLNIPTAGDLHV